MQSTSLKSEHPDASSQCFFIAMKNNCALLLNVASSYKYYITILKKKKTIEKKKKQGVIKMQQHIVFGVRNEACKKNNNMNVDSDIKRDLKNKQYKL